MPIRRRKYHGLYFHSSAPRGKWNVKFIQHIFLFSIVIERGTKHSRWWTVGNVWGCQLHESKQALGWINCAFIFQNFENSNSNWTWQRFFFCYSHIKMRESICIECWCENKQNVFHVNSKRFFIVKNPSWLSILQQLVVIVDFFFCCCCRFLCSIQHFTQIQTIWLRTLLNIKHLFSCAKWCKYSLRVQFELILLRFFEPFIFIQFFFFLKRNKLWNSLTQKWLCINMSR